MASRTPSLSRREAAKASKAIVDGAIPDRGAGDQNLPASDGKGACVPDGRRRGSAAVTRAAAASLAEPTCRIDAVAAAPGFLFVEGWVRGTEAALDRTTPHLAVAGDGGVAVAKLFRRRDLVALETEGLVARAFAVTLPHGGEAGIVPTLRLSLGAVTVPADTANVSISPFVPRGHIDVIDHDGIVGWLFDPRVEAGHAWCSLAFDGNAAIAITCDEQRDDLPLQGFDPATPLGFRLPMEALCRAARASDPAFAPFDGGEHVALLMAGGEMIDRKPFALPSEHLGFVERIADALISGWGVDPVSPDLPALVEITVDDVRFAEATAGHDRPDLLRANITRSGGGFRATLPPYLVEETGTTRIGARLFGRAAPLDSGTEPPPPPLLRGRGRRRSWHAGPLPDPISIIIAIHDAPAPLAACLTAVMRHTTAPARLILIDDASTDPAVASVLDRYRGHAGVGVFANERRLGYTATINRGLALAERDSVVLLNSDTVVTAGWLDSLRIACAAQPRVGTVTPLSDNAGAFSAPEPNVANRPPPHLSPDGYALLVRHASLALFPSVPTGNGFCLLITRACLDAVGGFDSDAFPEGYGEENDFCMRAGRAGFASVIDDRCFVAHIRSASFGARRPALEAAGRAVVDARHPDYAARITMFQDDHDILTMRWAVRRAVIAARAEPRIPRERVLFVISTLTGGTPQTNRDLMLKLADRYEPFLLGSDGGRVTLSRVAEAGDTVVESVALRRQITAAAHESDEYDAIIAGMLVRYAFTLVHVRHLAWHGLGLLATCRRMLVPVVLSFHDFYTICPTIKLLDDRMRFCGGTCTAGEGECIAELWPRETMPPLKHRFAPLWKARMDAAIEAADAFVCTSESARRTLLAAHRPLEGRDVRLIAHGRDFARFERLNAPASPGLREGERLRVLVPGNISAAKGARLIDAAAAHLREGRRPVEFHVLGDAGTITPSETVILHGRYEREAFAERVRVIAPHVGAILSIWPETWSHTLTELWACGLPVLAIRLGAVGERMERHGGGWLLDEGSAQAVCDAIERLLATPWMIEVAAAEVAVWQAGEGRARNVAAMAADYAGLYREVKARRRAFGEADAGGDLT